jgi:hypothetical protein
MRHKPLFTILKNIGSNKPIFFILQLYTVERIIKVFQLVFITIEFFP